MGQNLSNNTLEAQIFKPPKPASYTETSLPGKFVWINVPSRNDRIAGVFYEFKDRETGEGGYLTILFSIGYSEDMGMYINWLKIMMETLKVNVMCYDYSGYGLSPGTPSEKNCYEDIYATYTYLVEVEHIPAEKIILYGKSLGSGPTIHLAAFLSNKSRVKGTRSFRGLGILNVTSSGDLSTIENKGGSITLISTVAGIVLQSPMTSVLRIVNQKIPGADIFENIKKLSKIKIPFLIFHGTDDTTIPITHSRKICKKVKLWKFIELDKADHMNIESEYSNEVLDTMIDFINYLAPELQSKVKMKNAPSAIQNDPMKVVGDWLKEIGLPQYTQTFLQNGFFQLAYIKTLEPIDLEIIGILDETHKEIILSAAKKLGEQPNVEEIQLGQNEKDELDAICQEFSSVIDLARARRYKALFLRYDTDNSREMNSTKLKNMMEKIGLPKSGNELKEMIEQADTTGKGVINFRDFLRVMCDAIATRDRSNSGQAKKLGGNYSFRRTSSRDIRKKRFGWKKEKSSKLVSEIVEYTNLPTPYVEEVIKTIFNPIYERTKKYEIPEEDFLSLFEGRLGYSTPVKRIFRSLASGANLTTKVFFSFLKTMEFGSPEEKLKIIFLAYDIDESDTLELNELTNLYDQMMTIGVLNGMEQSTIVPEVEKIKKILDPTNKGSISAQMFLKVGCQNEEILKVLIPDPLLPSSNWINVFSHINMSHDLNDATLDLFQLCQNYESQDVAYVQNIINAPGVEFNAIDLYGNPPLYYAIHKNRIPLIKMLLSKPEVKLNSKFKSGSTLLHSAVEKGEVNVLKILLDNGSNINEQDDVGWTPLHRAFKAEKEEIGTGIYNCIVELINRGADLSIRDCDGCTPLDLAVRYGQTEHIDLMVSKGADINNRSREDYTPLHWAAASGYVNCVKKLISLGADVNARSRSATTPLHLAAMRNYINCIEKLVEEKAEVCAQDALGRTPLHLADDSRCVYYLLKHGPEALKMVDNQKNTPLMAAKSRNSEEAVKILQEGPLQEQSEFSKNLLSSFRKGDNDKVLKLLKQPQADFHAANENGTTLLHYAAMQGRSDIIELLVSKGANPNIGNNRNTVPLHKAAQRGQLDALKCLIQAGADLNLQDEDKMTPIHRAINELNPQKNPEKPEKIKACIVELINRRARINLTDKDGYFPLDLVAKYGLTDCVEMLVKAGGDIQHVSNNGYTPLHHAAAGGHVSTIKKLIELGAQVNCDVRVPPLHVAIQFGHFEAFDTLLQLGANIDSKDHQLRTPLHNAAYYGALKISAHLLDKVKKQSALSQEDKEGNTPLHLVKTEAIADYLVQSGANINSLNLNKETPLLVSVQIHGNVELIKRLIYLGADVNVKNKFGDSALYLAARAGFPECVKLLKAYNNFTEQVNSTTIKYVQMKEEIYPRIVAATIDKLIQQLCYEKYTDEKFLRTFFITYSQFLSPHQLLDKLIAQYKSQSIVVFEAQENININNYKPPPGIISTLYYWIKYSSQDFNTTMNISDTFLKFVRTHLGAHGKILERLFTESMEVSVHHERKLTKSGSIYHTTELTKLPVDVLAKQLTLIDLEFLQAIEPNEFLGQAWDDDNSESKAPNILASTRRFNQVSSWIISEIVGTEKKSNRVKLIEKFITLAKTCFDFQNFQTTMSVLTALESTPVSRLKLTWRELAKHSSALSTFRELQAIFKSDESHKKYKEVLAKCQGPCVPFLGIALSDLELIDDNKQNYLTENGITLVNFEKCILVAEIVTEIQKYQNLRYDFQPDAAVKMSLMSISSLPEKEAIARSHRIEPQE